jgi:hypothetical protein
MYSVNHDATTDPYTHHCAEEESKKKSAKLKTNANKNSPKMF